MLSRLVLLLAAVMLPVTTCAAHAADYPRSELLIEAKELLKPAAAAHWIVLDARPQDAFAREHLPNARWVDHDAWAKDFGDGKDVSAWSGRIGKLGIGRASSVVVYDDTSMKNAARIWWILRYWGLDDVRLLNGGWKGWKADGFPTAAGQPGPVTAVEFTAQPRAERLATKDQILSRLADKPLQIVDARSENEFCGIDKLKNQRGGAIPGAIHLEWSDLIDQSTGRFKGPDELRQLFHKAGVDLSQPTATHCQSGGRASVMAFGLELMGAQDVRNYYRGWSEWGNAADTPIVAGKSAEKH